MEIDGFFEAETKSLAGMAFLHKVQMPLGSLSSHLQALHLVWFVLVLLMFE
jgi:hypothetical protein